MGASRESWFGLSSSSAESYRLLQVPDPKSLAAVPVLDAHVLHVSAQVRGNKKEGQEDPDERQGGRRRLEPTAILVEDARRIPTSHSHLMCCFAIRKATFRVPALFLLFYCLLLAP